MQLGAEPTRVINIGLNQQCPAGYTASDYPTYRSCRYSGFPPVASGSGQSPAMITVSPTIQTQVSPQVSPVFQQAFQPQQSPMTAGTTQTMPTTQTTKSPQVVATSPQASAPASQDSAKMYELMLQAQREEAAAQRQLVSDILTKFGTQTVSAPVSMPAPVSAPAPIAFPGGAVTIPEIPEIEKGVIAQKDNKNAALIAGAVVLGAIILWKGNKK